ncbi:MAG: RNA polymerase sigma factor [Xanthomonadales bacterium]|jgi:RNA polymerase sigma-70 factor (ECF subfamily)|nr:RNA polymerase sigma factor [Xanthomonadales bacterium]
MLLMPDTMFAKAAPSSIDEGDLVLRAQRGDSAAVSTLYQSHAPRAYLLALRLCAQPALAEDIVQDSFVRVLEGIGNFRGEAPFFVWLKRTVTHLSIDALRRMKRWQYVDIEESVLEHLVAGEPDRQLDALGLLRQLRPQARAVLVLHELEGLSHDEIGALFQRTPSYSKSLLSRAKQQLGLLLDQQQASKTSGALQ